MREVIPTSFSTPILNSGVLPPLHRKKAPSTVRGLLTILAGIIVLLPVIAWTDKSKNPRIAFILCISALVLTITIHELGHLFAGWMVGFRFRAIHVGPFSLSLEHGKPKVRLYREMLASGSAGMNVGTVLRLRRRLLIFVAGGPAANLLSIPATVLLVNHVFTGLGETRAGTLAAQFTVFSLIAGMVNLMPIQAGFLSDGARMEMLLRSRDRSRRWLSIAALANLHGDGTRARNWKSTWVRAAASVRDASLDGFAGNWLAYMWAYDRDDATSASLHLERCLELVGKLPSSARNIVAQEAAVFSAWFRDDASLADQWATQVKKIRTLPRLVRIRLDVALRCAHRDYGVADLSWREGLAFIEGETSGTAREKLRESWLEWHSEIQERKT